MLTGKKKYAFGTFMNQIGLKMRTIKEQVTGFYRANGQDLAFITVEAVDASGQPDPNAEHQVRFTLKGPGAIAAVGNGDMTSEEPYQGSQRKLFHGKALVVLRTSRTAGTLTLIASAPGLKGAAIQVASRG